VGRIPRSAADALVGFQFVGYGRVRGNPRGPRGLPHNLAPLPTLEAFSLFHLERTARFSRSSCFLAALAQELVESNFKYVCQ